MTSGPGTDTNSRVKHPELHDAAWLTRRYVTEGATGAEIAVELGAHKGTVCRALAAHGIPARPPSGGAIKHPELHDAAWLTRRYVTDQANTTQIAAELGCRPGTVPAALAAHGIPARRRSGRPVKYPELRDAAWLTRRHADDQAPPAEIAAEVGCTVSLVYQALAREGLSRRAGRAT